MRGTDVPFYTTASSATTFKANVGIGSPPTYYTLIVDTGSANTWISARGSHPYKQTETSKESRHSISIKYGTGSFRGKLWYDRVTLCGLVIEDQGIGVADNAFGFDPDVDGILGLGLVELTREFIVKKDEDEEELENIPTIIDNLFLQGKIQQRTLAIGFDQMPRTIKSEKYDGTFHGVLTFGGTDPCRYMDEITYVPIPQDKPSSKHWSLEQKIMYGSAIDGVEILKGGIGVIDTGSSVVHLRRDAFQAYRNAANASFNYWSGLLSLHGDRRDGLKSLFFEIGGKIFEVPPEDQVWPQELNAVAGGPPEDLYMVYVELVSDNGVEISLINGFTWLQNFYTVLDVDNKRIGIAKACPPEDRNLTKRTTLLVLRALCDTIGKAISSALIKFKLGSWMRYRLSSGPSRGGEFISPHLLLTCLQESSFLHVYNKVDEVEVRAEDAVDQPDSLLNRTISELHDVAKVSSMMKSE